MTVPSAGTGGEGEAIASFGRVISDIASQEHEKITGAEAQQAINALQKKALERRYGKPDDPTEPGFVSRRGAAAVLTPQGEEPLQTKYANLFQADQEEIMNGLSPSAKAKVSARANEISLGFQADLMRHGANELSTYHKQNDEDTLATGMAVGRANGDNPELLAKTRGDVAAAAIVRAQHEGHPNPEAHAQQQVARFHGAVIDGKLATGDVEGANTYLKKFKDDMGDNLLAAVQKVDHVRGQYAAAAVVAATDARFASDIKPSPAKAAFNVVAQDPALGAQTNEAGFRKLLTSFDGDLPKAWAALADPRGEAGVREAIARAEKSAKLHAVDPSVPMLSWMDAIGPETSKKILKAQMAYEAGHGTREPTVLEFKNAALDTLKKQYADVTPGMAATVAAQAEARYNDLMANRRDEQNRALLYAQKQIDTGTVKAFEQFTPEQKRNFGSSAQAVRNYQEAKNKADDRILEASPDAMQTYENLRLNASELVKPENLRPLMELSDKIGIKRVEKLLTLREQYLADPTAMVKAKVPADMIKVETQALKGSTKELALKRAKVNDYVDEALLREPNATPARVRQIVQEALIELPKVKKEEDWFAHPKKVYELTGAEKIDMGDNRPLITEYLKKRGIPATEENILAAYKGMLAQQQKAKK